MHVYTYTYVAVFKGKKENNANEIGEEGELCLGTAGLDQAMFKDSNNSI